MSLPPALAPLAAYKQFITYRLVPHIDKPGKFDKLPCVWSTGDVTAKGSGGAHDPAVWASADDAHGCQILADRGHGSGIGFVFTKDDPYWVVDIDNCAENGQWNQTAKDVMAALPGAAIEVSQSGKGLHLFGRGVVPEHRCKNIPLGLEFYTSGRFIALSKNGATGNIDTDLSALMPAFVEKYFQPMQSRAGAVDEWTSEPCEGWYGPEDDDELLEKMLKSKSVAATFGDAIRFKDLFERDVDKLAAKWPGSNDGGYDASSADMSLATYLAFWTGRNCERMETLMRRSELFREKYERHAYLTTTIMKAASISESVYCETPKVTPEQVLSAREAATPVTPASEVPPPPGNGRFGQHMPVMEPGMEMDKGSHLNLEWWIKKIGDHVRFDQFAAVIRFGDEAITDDLERKLFFDIREQSRLKFAQELFTQVLRLVAYQNRYHPLKEYLDDVQTRWDGTPRIDSWLTTYLGVEASPFSNAVGALFLTALVRRPRSPGAKFDEMLVLEGPQGIEKSSALAALCPHEGWFTDEVSVGMQSKELLEITNGKWIVEAPELRGMVGRGVDHVKAFLSRRYDKARLSYDRNTTERGREWVAAASTNDDKYLDDPTGNRRVWPVVVSKVDLAGIRADRDQLWAEAAVREASGASIRLPQELWAVAAGVQSERVLYDSLQEDIAELLDGKTGRVRGRDVLTALSYSPKDRAGISRKFGTTMRALGWDNKLVKIDGKPVRFFVKGEPTLSIILENGKLGYEATRLQAV